MPAQANRVSRRSPVRVRARALGSLLCITWVLAATGCRPKPVDQQALLTTRDLALTDLERGRLPEAEGEFKQIIALAPRDPLGYANLGLTYLRGGRFADAEAPLRQARRLDPTNPDIGLMMARLYVLTGRSREARELLGTLGHDAKVAYAQAQLEKQDADTAARARYEARLREVLALSPENLAVRLELVDALVRRGDADSALAYLEAVRRLRPEPPADAEPFLDTALQALRTGQVAAARDPLDRFLHAMEVTAPYQAALQAIAWTDGPLVGRPVLTFNPQSIFATRARQRGARPVEPRFTDVTRDYGLSDLPGAPTALALGDYDGDGTDELFVSMETAGRFVSRLYRVRGGAARDVSPGTDLSLPTGAIAARFADVDNDGWLDLFVIGADGRGVLLRNTGRGRFVDVTASAGVGRTDGARHALAVDLDHDGDLDLLLPGSTGNLVYRNNADGTFTESAGPLGLRGTAGGAGAAFGDFDGDARVDLVVGSARDHDALYRNTGMQRFADVTRASGFNESHGSGGVAVGDYDNDGDLDLLTLSAAGGAPALWRNDGAGSFTHDARATGTLRPARHLVEREAEFIDYDNDGWLDLVVAEAHGLLLLRNDRRGSFEDRSAQLPPMLRAGGPVTAFVTDDVDGDGDQDLIVGDSSGLHLLRNDGGNANLSMQVQLVALRTGSGKNNEFGIGATVQVRAGELYQTRVVTSRITPFGLGPHLKADVLRVQWTNGVPQTVYFPGTDADVVELEQLKGSCAFLYTLDGTGFRFVTDVMWRSALGMPLGLMAGGRGAAYAPAGASQEYLRIPADALQARRGRYILQITEELWETAYLDELRLLAVDHPDSVDVFVDERFVPPGPVALRLFKAVGSHPPRSAVDDRGGDVLPALRARDDAYVADLVPTAWQGVVEPHDLVMDLGEDAGRPGTLLLLRGWIYPTDASINVALSQQSTVRPRIPSLEVRDARGRWTTAFAAIGFPSGKDKTIVIDLTGAFPTADHHVRIHTNMQIYWDQALIAHQAPESPARVTALPLLSADLHARGFSRMYRRGGRNGPHWFAYGDVSPASPWRPIEGAFTRFGDVLPLLRHSDDMYVVMAAGDEATIVFDSGPAGPLPAGWRRTFLLYSDGWIKDADLNTAFGNTVEPLPFHAITRYPPAPGGNETYPDDPTHRQYLREYETRVIRRR